MDQTVVENILKSLASPKETVTEITKWAKAQMDK